jgi:hypothetical protein
LGENPLSELIYKPTERIKQWEKEQKLTESHLKILYYIINESETYYNEIRETALRIDGTSNATVVTALKRLLKNSLIKEIRQEEGDRGRAKIIYGPTLSGLITGFYHFPELWGRIDEIAYRNGSLLPLIFGKWDLYRTTSMFRNPSNFDKYRRDVQEEYKSLGLTLTNNLSSIISLNLLYIFQTKIWKLKFMGESEKLVDEVTFEALLYLDKIWLREVKYHDIMPFTAYFSDLMFNDVKQLWSGMVLGDTPREMILLILAAKDEDLRNYFTNILDALKTYHRTMMENILKTEKVWQGVIRITA